MDWSFLHWRCRKRAGFPNNGRRGETVREYGGGGAKYGGGSNVNADFKSASSSLFFFPSPPSFSRGTEMLANILKAEALPSCEREEVEF
jgi:hypothetical protein